VRHGQGIEAAPISLTFPILIAKGAAMADHMTDRVYLQRGGIVRLGEVGTRVTCRSGVLWLTFADDPRDVLLEVGEDFVVDREGLTLVCAIAGPAAAEIIWPGQAATSAGAELAPTDARRAA